jgi:competence protein ComGC
MMSGTQAINIDNKNAASNAAGFTLVEAMISMLVTVVGLVSLAGMFTVAMKTNASSRNFTTATTFAQDKLEQLGAISFQRLVDPGKMRSNPNASSADDAYVAGNIEQDAWGPDGSYYFDKIILAGRDDVEPEGTVTVVRPDGTAETRRPDGTISVGNPFGDDRTTYSRCLVIVSSRETNPADRRFSIAVRVKSENATTGKAPELVDLYTVMSNQ